MRRRGADPPTGEHTAPLTEAPVDAEGVVTALGTRDQREIQKLLAVGILPGVDIRLIRQFPAFVFQVGYSQFTVDRELAGKIIVRWRGRKA
jgi:Fe2+ transport system protein FeoA